MPQVMQHPGALHLPQGAVDLDADGLDLVGHRRHQELIVEPRQRRLGHVDDGAILGGLHCEELEELDTLRRRRNAVDVVQVAEDRCSRHSLLREDQVLAQRNITP